MITNIIKVRNYETRCDHCGTRFCFEEEDFKNNIEPDAVCGSEVMTQYVICPVCNKHNMVIRAYNKPLEQGQMIDNIAVHWVDEKPEINDKLFSQSWEHSDFTPRTKNVLRACGVLNLRQLVQSKADDLIKTEFMGKRSYMEICDKLASLNLRFEMTEEDITSYLKENAQ